MSILEKSYLAEQFRQIKCSMAELFRQIKRSLAEQFRHIKRSVAGQYLNVNLNLERASEDKGCFIRHTHQTRFVSLVFVVCTIQLGCVQTKINIELAKNHVGHINQLLTS